MIKSNQDTTLASEEVLLVIESLKKQVATDRCVYVMVHSFDIILIFYFYEILSFGSCIRYSVHLTFFFILLSEKDGREQTKVGWHYKPPR